MKITVCAAIGVAIALAGCTSVPRTEPVDEGTAKLLATLTPTGEVSACLPNGFNDSFMAVNERQILIRASPTRYFLNNTNGRCAGATRAFNRFQYTVRGSQLCRLEIINIVENTTGMIVGACSLGDFVELRRKTDEELAADGIEG